MGRRPRPVGMHLAPRQSAPRLGRMPRMRPACYAPRSSASTPRDGVQNRARREHAAAPCGPKRVIRQPLPTEERCRHAGGVLTRPPAPSAVAQADARSVCAPAFCAPCPVIDRRDGAGPRGVQRCCCERGSRLCTLKLWIARAAHPSPRQVVARPGRRARPKPPVVFRGRVPASGEVLHGRGCVSWARSHRLRFFQRPFQASNPPGQKTQE